MNRKTTLSADRAEYPDNGEYIVRRSRRTDAIALAVCLVLAFALWLVSMNMPVERVLPVRVAGAENYTVTVSAPGVRVRGAAYRVRKAGEVQVNLPLVVAGTYTVGAEALSLPEGVSLPQPVALTVTLTAK